MKTTDDAYETIMDHLAQIEDAAVRGAFAGNAQNCCLEVKGLVHKTRQVVNKSFYLPRNFEETIGTCKNENC